MEGDSLDRLVNEVRAGDPVALRVLGQRLLLGDGVPHQPREGVDMLRESCAKGDAGAAAQLSVLHALGLHVQQGWQLALRALVLAAQRGDAASIEQLRLLARAGDGDAAAPETLAARVDLDGWVAPLAPEVLSETPVIRAFPDFLPPAMCRWLIAKSHRRLRRAQVYDAVGQRVVTHHTRSNSVALFNLADTDLIQLLMQARMAVCTGLPFRHFEASSVLHYTQGQQITNHYDFIDPQAPDYARQLATQGQRVVTFLVYLNDDYEGGATGFPEVNLHHKGQTGEGLFFVNVTKAGEPDLSTLHAGEPPTMGEKWVVSQFIRDRPVF